MEDIGRTEEPVPVLSLTYSPPSRVGKHQNHAKFSIVMEPAYVMMAEAQEDGT